MLETLLISLGPGAPAPPVRSVVVYGRLPLHVDERMRICLVSPYRFAEVSGITSLLLDLAAEYVSQWGTCVSGTLGDVLMIAFKPFRPGRVSR